MAHINSIVVIVDNNRPHNGKGINVYALHMHYANTV